MTTTASGASAQAASATRFVIDTAKQGGDQALALYRQGAKFSPDATGMWLETLSSLVPGAKIPPASLSEALTQYTNAAFDVAEKAVQVQRELFTEAIGLLQSR